MRASSGRHGTARFFTADAGMVSQFLSETVEFH